jgi:hypothetical protein
MDEYLYKWHSDLRAHIITDGAIDSKAYELHALALLDYNTDEHDEHLLWVASFL